MRIRRKATCRTRAINEVEFQSGFLIDPSTLASCLLLNAYSGWVGASRLVEICFVVIGFIRGFQFCGLDCQCLQKFSLGKVNFVKID
ncbi:unnamed protein product [Citrullus colocynthis]|uniref:Uncharacterized protein n=1 Tax=Citrullus colocynthis TaxID=252529 RepID=A0ABP0XNC3_9ROSI